MQWKPIVTAPFDRDLEVAIHAEGNKDEPHLEFPFVMIGAGLSVTFRQP